MDRGNQWTKLNKTLLLESLERQVLTLRMALMFYFSYNLEEILMINTAKYSTFDKPLLRLYFITWPNDHWQLI